MTRILGLQTHRIRFVNKTKDWFSVSKILHFCSTLINFSKKVQNIFELVQWSIFIVCFVSALRVHLSM